MLTLMTTVAALDLSIDNLLLALLVFVISIILLVALWRFVAPQLGEFAGLVRAVIVVVVLIIIARILGIV